jgi:hypothetical protein
MSQSLDPDNRSLVLASFSGSSVKMARSWYLIIGRAVSLTTSTVSVRATQLNVSVSFITKLPAFPKCACR